MGKTTSGLVIVVDTIISKRKNTLLSVKSDGQGFVVRSPFIYAHICTHIFIYTHIYGTFFSQGKKN